MENGIYNQQLTISAMLYSKSPYVSNLVSLLSEGCFINVDIVNSILTTFNFGIFQFWQFNNLAIFNFDNFQFWQLSILATFNFGNFQFQQPSVLATFNSKTFTIFNLGFFQAKFPNNNSSNISIVSCNQKKTHLSTSL